MSIPLPEGAAIIIDAHRTVELLTAQRTRDVYEILAVTAENNVAFHVRVPVALVDPIGGGPDALSIRQTAIGIAVSIDSLFSLTNVIGVTYVQDVSPTNQLVDLVEIYVQSDNGLATDYLRWPLEAVDLRVVEQPILDLAAKLNALVTP